MSRCRVCGGYCDVFDYPEDQRENYRPNVCFNCYQEQLAQEDDEQEADDPNTEFGMTEVKPNPEDDDTPDLQDFDNDENENNEMEENNDDEESEPLPDDTLSITNIKRMLFG